MRARILVALLGLGAIAIAAPRIWATQWEDGPAPARFRGPASATVQFLSAADVNRVCARNFADTFGVTIFACSTRREVSRGSMTLPNPCDYPDEDRYALLVCHEIGHLNGWPSTHGA